MTASVWPRRFALFTFVSTLVLVLVGSQVTTTGSGMAVEGWLMAKGENGTYYFMPFFPFAEWFRDHPTAYEHTHRMLGVLVGLGAIATVVGAHRARIGRGAVAAAWVALVAICVQGLIGGLRVDLNAPDLAFLHGVTGQLTLALVGACAVTTSRVWQSTGAGRVAGGPRDLAVVTAVLVLGQIALGAWYRHGLRNPDFELFKGALHMHMTGAFVVLGLVIALAVRVTLYARRVEEAGDGELAARLVAGKKRLHALVGTQILLGFAAWMAFGDPATVSLAESVLAALHLFVGALLLVQTVVLVLWLTRSGAGVTMAGREVTA